MPINTNLLRNRIYAVAPTPDQRKAALVEVENALIDVRDLLRRLDLPVSAIDVVLPFYYQQVGVLVDASESAKDRALDKKRGELVALQMKKGIHPGVHPGLQPTYLAPQMHGHYDALDPNLLDLDETELDARIAKLKSE